MTTTEKDFADLMFYQQRELMSANKRREELGIPIFTEENVKDCRFVLDTEADSIMGYRRPMMFNHGIPMKWETAVRWIQSDAVKWDDADQPQDPVAPKTTSPDAVTTAPQGGDVVWLKHSQICASPLNPRTVFDPEAMSELKTSLHTYGFNPEMSRLLVRPVGNKYELVYGERRWRAMGDLISAGVIDDRLPCNVTTLTDTQVIELTLVEVITRQGLTPLDEAVRIVQLLELKGEDGQRVHTAETLAARIGKSDRHVWHCKSVAKLKGTLAGAALTEGKLTWMHARLLGTIPPGRVQDELLIRTLSPSDGRGTVSHDVLKQWIRDEVMIPLASLEFDPQDETLVPEVESDGQRIYGGACDTCPCNTKNTAEPELDSKGRKKGAVPMCVHVECFRAKVAKVRQRWQEEMAAKGFKVLNDEQAVAMLDASGERLAVQSGMVELDEKPEEWLTQEGAEVTQPWKRMIKAQNVPVTVFRDTAGRVHEVVPRNLAISAAQANGHDVFKRSLVPAQEENSGPKPESRVDAAAEAVKRDAKEAEAEAKLKRDQALARRITAAQVAALFEKARGTKVPDEFWELAASVLIGTLDEHGDLHPLAVAKGMEVKKGQLPATESQPWMRRYAAKLEQPFLVALVVELLFGLYYDSQAEKELPKWAKVFGADLKAAAESAKAAFLAEEEKAEEEREIAEGFKLPEKRRVKVDEYDWCDGICLNPTEIELGLPKVKGNWRIVVLVGRHKNGWSAGFRMFKGKNEIADHECNLAGAIYGNEMLAAVARLKEISDELDAPDVAAPKELRDRVIAYVVRITTATPQGRDAMMKGGK